MRDTNETLLSVQGTWLAIRRHRRKSLVFFLAVMAAAVAALLLIPPTYRSEAKLFLRLGRENVAIDPTATTGATVTVTDARANEINSVLEILESRAIFDKVVAALHPDTILQKGPGDTSGWSLASIVDPVKNALLRPLPISDEERATDILAKSIDVSSGRNSNVITVACRADSPELAQQILSKLLEVFGQEHVRVNRTDGSHEFFLKQADVLHAQWEQAAAALRDAKNRMGFALVDGRRSFLQEQSGTLENQLLRTDVALAASRAKAERLTESINALPQRLVTAEESGLPNMARDYMRQQLYSLEIREQELLARSTPDHPEVVAIRQQVEDVRKILEEQSPNRVTTTEDRNDNREALELSLLTEQAALGSLEAERELLRQQVSLVDDHLREVNQQEVEIAELQRQVDLVAASYRTCAEKREQTRIDEALEVHGISNVSLVQPPSRISKPVSPRKALVLFLGLCVALSGGVGIPLLLESLDNSLRTPEEVEQQLQLPVLMSMPHSSRRSLLISRTSPHHDSPIHNS